MEDLERPNVETPSLAFGATFGLVVVATLAVVNHEREGLGILSNLLVYGVLHLTGFTIARRMGERALHLRALGSLVGILLLGVWSIQRFQGGDGEGAMAGFLVGYQVIRNATLRTRRDLRLAALHSLVLLVYGAALGTRGFVGYLALFTLIGILFQIEDSKGEYRFRLGLRESRVLLLPALLCALLIGGVSWGIFLAAPLLPRLARGVGFDVPVVTHDTGKFLDPPPAIEGSRLEQGGAPLVGKVPEGGEPHPGLVGSGPGRREEAAPTSPEPLPLPRRGSVPAPEGLLEGLRALPPLVAWLLPFPFLLPLALVGAAHWPERKRLPAVARNRKRLHECYEAACRRLARYGYRRSLAESPAEFLASLPAAIREGVPALVTLTQTYEACCYGGKPVDAERVRRMARVAREIPGQLRHAVRTHRSGRKGVPGSGVRPHRPA